VQNLAGPFEAAGGARIEADFAPTLGLLDRLRNGEEADVVILTREGLDGLAAQGSVVAASCVDLARSYVGLAVKAGADHPDIADITALRTTLLNARAVAYSRIGASGIFFAQLIERMGIAPEIDARASIVPSGLTAERLVSGEADLAVQQLSELMQVRGVEVVGPIPRELQTPAVFCFPPEGLRRRRGRSRPTRCWPISPPPKSRRCCARPGSNLESARSSRLTLPFACAP
jgi:molybdate transport system substrate-binding protein